MDFSFIHDYCKDLYCADNGRPAVEPKLLFKMLFLGLKMTEKGSDYATISINRVRRFRNINIAEQIFSEILRQCIAKGLVGGKILFTDSTHINAKANKQWLG